MHDFMFYTPTRVFFGKNALSYLGTALQERRASRVLLHFGGHSALSCGLIEQIEAQLREVKISSVRLGGVLPNPRIELVREGITLCKKENIDFILAVGGGSVIDSAKSIGMGLANEKDPWEMISGNSMPQKHFPLGCVLTIAAAGSEMSNSHVITNGVYKRSLNHDLLRPDVAFLNPELTYTVPRFQTGCGTVDIMMHTLERFFTQDAAVQPTDAIALSLLKQVKIFGEIAAEEPQNYEARAALMWASSLSHNGLTGCGKNTLFPVHKLEHDFSGLYDVAHGAGLSVLFPAWAQYIYSYDIPRFAALAREVFGVCEQQDEAAAVQGIRQMKTFFRKIGMPVTMAELGIDEKDFYKIADMTTDSGGKTILSYIPLKKEDILKIYQLAK